MDDTHGNKTAGDRVNHALPALKWLYQPLTVFRLVKLMSVWIALLTLEQFFGEESDFEVKNSKIGRDRTP